MAETIIDLKGNILVVDEVRTTVPAGAPTATQVTATAITPGTATTVQGILAELAARITALENA